MNIRPLESLTKEELIELVKHERDDTQNLRNNFLNEINRKNSTIQGLIDRSNLPYLLKSGEVHFWDREGNNNIETLCSGAAVLIYANDLMQLIARSNECEGWKLVPVEPTEAMLLCGWCIGLNGKEAYLQVLAAAPQRNEPCAACNDMGAVGNILNAEPCPDCAPASPTAKESLTVEPTDSEMLDWVVDNWQTVEYTEDKGIFEVWTATCRYEGKTIREAIAKAMRGEK